MEDEFLPKDRAFALLLLRQALEMELEARERLGMTGYYPKYQEEEE